MRRGLCALMMTLVLPLAACGGGGGNEAEALALEVRSRYLEDDRLRGTSGTYR